MGGPYQDPVDITRNVDMAQLDATNGPGLQGSVTRGDDQLMGKLTRGNPTNDANPDAAGDPGQETTPDTRHFADAREVGERQHLYTKVRQTRWDNLQCGCTFVASRMSVHVSPEVSTFPTCTDFSGVADFGVEGVSISRLMSRCFPTFPTSPMK